MDMSHGREVSKSRQPCSWGGEGICLWSLSGGGHRAGSPVGRIPGRQKARACGPLSGRGALTCEMGQ